MRSCPKKHHRSLRLRGHDYAQPGASFITVCTRNRECMYGEVLEGEMRLNDAGQIAQRCWPDIPAHYSHAALDAYVVMPNHVHGIIVIQYHVGAKNFSPLHKTAEFRSPSKTIGSIVRGFKIGVTKWFRQHTHIWTVWQRNYYEHIIRDERSLNRIRQYIVENPLRWEMDRENPACRAANETNRPEGAEPWRI